MKWFDHLTTDEAPPLGLAPLYAVLAGFFRMALLVRGAAYDAQLFRSEEVDRPVISVGNLRVGGTGKTPFVVLLTSTLESMGYRVGIVSRGHGARNPRSREGASGATIVSKGGGPLVEVHVSGDEPWLLAKRTRAIVVVSKDRVAAARAAIALGANIIVMDDGFQHRRLARDLDIVLLPAEAPLGNGHVLPWGALREPMTALRRAHLLVLTRAPGPNSLRAPLARPPVPGRSESGRPAPLVIDSLRASLARPLPVVEVAAVPVALERLNVPDDSDEAMTSLGQISAKQVAIFSGIARPKMFRQSVEALGATIVQEFHKQDHAWFTHEELEHFVDTAHRSGAEFIVTTEKDAARLPPQFFSDSARISVQSSARSAVRGLPAVHVLRVEHRVVAGEQHLIDALTSVFVDHPSERGEP